MSLGVKAILLGSSKQKLMKRTGWFAMSFLWSPYFRSIVALGLSRTQLRLCSGAFPSLKKGWAPRAPEFSPTIASSENLGENAQCSCAAICNGMSYSGFHLLAMGPAAFAHAQAADISTYKEAPRMAPSGPSLLKNILGAWLRDLLMHL